MNNATGCVNDANGDYARDVTGVTGQLIEGAGFGDADGSLQDGIAATPREPCKPGREGASPRGQWVG